MLPPNINARNKKTAKLHANSRNLGTNHISSFVNYGWMDGRMDGSIELVNESGRGWGTLEKTGLDVAIFINTKTVPKQAFVFSFII